MSLFLKLVQSVAGLNVFIIDMLITEKMPKLIENRAKRIVAEKCNGKGFDQRYVLKLLSGF